MTLMSEEKGKKMLEEAGGHVALFFSLPRLAPSFGGMW